MIEIREVSSLISSRALNCPGTLVSNGWRFLPDAKGVETIPDFIEHASDGELYELSFLLAFDMSALSESDITYLGVIRMSSMPHVLDSLKRKVEGESGWKRRDKLHQRLARSDHFSTESHAIQSACRKPAIMRTIDS